MFRINSKRYRFIKTRLNSVLILMNKCTSQMFLELASNNFTVNVRKERLM